MLFLIIKIEDLYLEEDMILLFMIRLISIIKAILNFLIPIIMENIKATNMLGHILLAIPTTIILEYKNGKYSKLNGKMILTYQKNEFKKLKDYIDYY